MPITLTWNDGLEAPTTFTMPDEVVESIDKLRAETVALLPDGTLAPQYSTVKEMIVGTMVQTIALPALTRFPTASVQQALAAVQAAQLAYMQAQTAAIPGFVPGGGE